MFLYTLKITVRNTFRNKTFSLINILGLSLGLTGVILILLWVWDELNYDRFYENSESIYILVNKNTDDEGNSIEYVESPPPMAGYLVNNFPEIKETARVEYFYNGGLIQIGNEVYTENGAAVDNSFLNIFNISFIYGNDFSNNPESIIISENIAKKYYGDKNPVGETLKVKGYGEDYKTVLIAGVFKDFPDNSSIQFDFIIPFSLEEKYYSDNWNVAIYTTFALLKENNNLNHLNEKVAGIYKNVINDNHFKSYLFPLKKLHLHSPLTFFNNHDQGNIQLIYLMVLIAFIILIVACINYMNLATARSIKMMKEVSIKKILGANRKRLVSDFLTEAFLFSLISFQIAIIFVELLRPVFNSITGKNIKLNYFNPKLLVLTVVIIGLMSFISAIYPYLFFKSYKPVLYLKSLINQSTKKVFAKKALVVIQFTVSIVLIIFSSFIIKQLNYIYSKELGFNKENIIVLNESSLAGKESIFKDEILKHSDVISASIGKTPFGGGWPDSWSWEGKSSDSRLGVMRIEADADYLNILSLNLLDGRFFKKGYYDTNSVVINKKFADIIGGDEIIGKKLSFRGEQFDIIGITNNFNSHHFSEEIKPVAFFNEPTHKFLVKVKKGKINSVASFIKSEYKNLVVNQPFEYTTLQGQFNYLFKKEVRASKLFGYFSILAIFISCLGLFGISIFTSEQRTKEIGIRKTLGASPIRVIKMINLDFIKLIVLAFIISCPVAYYFVNMWLQNFVYRTALSWWVFAIVGFITLLFSIFTVSWQSFKAARKNPVESLRYE